jgi:hypothetical protein
MDFNLDTYNSQKGGKVFKTNERLTSEEMLILDNNK